MEIDQNLGDGVETEIIDPLADPEERRVLYAALDSFRQYRQAAHYNVTHRRRKAFYSLPSAHIDILCEPPLSLPETFNAVDEAIDSNADICDAILERGLQSFGIADHNESWKGQATSSDIDRARTTVRQLYRDWSVEGLPERHASHSPLIGALTAHLSPIPVHKRHQRRILVPGAGLGRLVFDICAAGYTVEGNEISYHQLLASDYILNCTQSAAQYTIYPSAMSFSNHTSRSNQLQSVSVPDVHPATEMAAKSAEIGSEIHHGERMSMTAGDFCTLYKQSDYEGSFDAVATCFFIDTAPNLIKYIETIKHCLKVGGIWINLGPLLWHFESNSTPKDRAKQRQHVGATQSVDTPSYSMGVASDAEPVQQLDEGIGEAGSFELSNDEVIALVQRFGLQILEQTEAPAGATGYIQDPASMLQNVYRPAFWVAKKLG